MKDINKYEGKYAVTKCGKIWSYQRKKFLKPTPNHNGYLRVCLRNNGDRKTFSVARLVAFAYIPKSKLKKYVNHIDGNKKNNHVENLEWCTARENIRHAWDNGLMKKRKKRGLVAWNGSSWVARVTLAGKQNYLGSFKDRELAREAVDVFLTAKGIHTGI